MCAKVYYVPADKSDSVGEITRKLSRLIEKSDVLKFVAKDDFTALKIHFGEEGNTGHIRHEWAKEAAAQVSKKTKNAFLTDTNVIYKASMRTNAVDHLKIAGLHGFNMEDMGVPIIIADGVSGRNFTEIPISKKHFSKVKIASDIAGCDSLIALTHATGHMLTGYGGAIKNLGMGCSSRRGKYEQHCGVAPDYNPSFCTGCGLCAANCPAGCITIKSKKVSISEKDCLGCGECAIVCKTKALEIKWSETLENLQEKMVEYAYGTVKALKGRTGYINFLIKVTKDCDCLAKDDPRIADDLGILASLDPVSIDKASIDMIKEHSGKDVFGEGYPETDWSAQLSYAARIGLGDMNYTVERL